jgi:hypothetical protein
MNTFPSFPFHSPRSISLSFNIFLKLLLSNKQEVTTSLVLGGNDKKRQCTVAKNSQFHWNCSNERNKKNNRLVVTAKEEILLRKVSGGVKT